MKDITGMVKSVFLEKTNETITTEWLLGNNECVYCFDDATINGKENEFKGELSRIEFNDDSNMITLYIKSSNRDKREIKVPGKIVNQSGGLVAYVSKTKIK